MHEQQQHGQQDEELITLGEAAKRTPGRPSANCVWRWCRKGVLTRTGQRIRLRHARIGGKIFTSPRWLNEFGQAVADADAEYFDQALAAGGDRPRRRRPLNRQQQQRQEHLDRVRRDLSAAGI